MPMFKLNRNYALRSLHGHIINFHRDVPVYIPPICIAEAVAAGAECVDGPVDVLGDEAVAKPELTFEQRNEVLQGVFEAMVKENKRGDFSAQGIPNHKVLSGRAGFAVDKRELEASWQKFLEAKAEAEAQAK